MTDEVGVVTGDLTLRTEYADGKVTLAGAVQGRGRVVRGDRRVGRAGRPGRAWTRYTPSRWACCNRPEG